MNEGLRALIVERLLEDERIDRLACALVEAACEGEEAVERALHSEGGPRSERDDAFEVARVEPQGAYLARLEVAGFRGVGEAVSIELPPGPGLTLFVGRNGSGKSSFAEGLETLLSGGSRRWEKLHRDFGTGWRNLHEGKSCHLEATFAVEGLGDVTTRRSWAAGAKLEEGRLTVRVGDTRHEDLSELGWDEAIVSFRPFLSYSELGALFDRPSELYDALESILGLGDLAIARDHLASRRKAMAKEAKGSKEAVPGLLASLAPLDDPRAASCVAALGSKPADLDAIEGSLTGGGQSEGHDQVSDLRRLAQLAFPVAADLEAAVEVVTESLAGVADLAGTGAEHGHALAGLLERALQFREAHGGADCPVCSADLDDGWLAATRTRMEAAREQAVSVQGAQQALAENVRALRGLVRPVPPSLSAAAAWDPEAAATRELWEQWAQPPGAPLELAAHVRGLALGMATAVSELREHATTRLAALEDRWKPVAELLMEWLPRARRVESGALALKAMKTAEKWFKGAEGELRDERFAPIAEHAQQIWNTLRQQSNVDLQRVQLQGAATSRRVSLGVTVDGTDGVALGVMSQGELHALALSLFLPRMTLAESPFRFLVVDDPVQAMDPAKVDGLARVLSGVAETRQVIVLTHDARLLDAVKRMQIDCRVLQVTRNAGSHLRVEPELDAVERYVNDAFALVKSETELGHEVTARVVPGLCRGALEAACLDAIRSRRLGRGDRHDDVQVAIEEATGIQELAALALFDDRQRGGDVYATLNNKAGGPWATDVFKACKEGAHDAHTGSLEEMVKSSRRLAKVLAAAR